MSRHVEGRTERSEGEEERREAKEEGRRARACVCVFPRPLGWRTACVPRLLSSPLFFLFYMKAMATGIGFGLVVFYIRAAAAAEGEKEKEGEREGRTNGKRVRPFGGDADGRRKQGYTDDDAPTSRQALPFLSSPCGFFFLSHYHRCFSFFYLYITHHTGVHSNVSIIAVSSFYILHSSSQPRQPEDANEVVAVRVPFPVQGRRFPPVRGCEPVYHVGGGGGGGYVCINGGRGPRD